jgi:hypothetical protein
MSRNIAIVSTLIGIAALLLWWVLQSPPGIETKSAAGRVAATVSVISLVTAIVSLATAVVTLITTLVKSREGGG